MCVRVCVCATNNRMRTMEKMEGRVKELGIGLKCLR